MCAKTKSKKEIDIEALSRMPITKEFAYLMFLGVDIFYNKEDINIEVFEDYLEYKLDEKYYLQIHSDGALCCGIHGQGYSCEEDYNEILNAYQIVNYIDSYLNNRCEHCGRYENINVCICGTDY